MYYLILGILFILVSLLSYVGIMFILAIASVVGNEICKLLGMKDSYLEIKARDIFAFTLGCILGYGILWLLGKLVSLFV